MTIKRKPSDARERDLQLPLARIQRGRAHRGESKVTIAAVAREAGVSTTLDVGCANLWVGNFTDFDNS